MPISRSRLVLLGCIFHRVKERHIVIAKEGFIEVYSQGITNTYRTLVDTEIGVILSTISDKH